MNWDLVTPISGNNILSKLEKLTFVSFSIIQLKAPNPVNQEISTLVNQIRTVSG